MNGNTLYIYVDIITQTLDVARILKFEIDKVYKYSYLLTKFSNSCYIFTTSNTITNKDVENISNISLVSYVLRGN